MSFFGMAVTSASAVMLSGATPNNLHRNCIGILHKRAQPVNSHVSYVHASDETTMLWHAGEHWYVGMCTELGQERGCIRARDGATDPAHIAAGWEAWDDQKKKKLLCGTGTRGKKHGNRRGTRAGARVAAEGRGKAGQHHKGGGTWRHVKNWWGR